MQLEMKVLCTRSVVQNVIDCAKENGKREKKKVTKLTGRDNEYL